MPEHLLLPQEPEWKLFFFQYPYKGRRRSSANREQRKNPYNCKKYGEAAKRVQAIGFDAIEIHCGHSYLMSQFISPYYNKRTDEFGGSVENRLRFPRMVLEEVRKNVGPWFPIIVRISAEERVPGGTLWKIHWNIWNIWMSS